MPFLRPAPGFLAPLSHILETGGGAGGASGFGLIGLCGGGGISVSVFGWILVSGPACLEGFRSFVVRRHGR